MMLETANLETANAGGVQEMTARRMALASAAAMLAMLAAGCGHHVNVSRTPSQQTAPQATTQGGNAGRPSAGTRPALGGNGAGNTGSVARIAPTPAPAGGVDEEDMDYIQTHQPISTEEGLATWYSAPYRGKKAANGQVFSDDALTAAHKTLPMGSLVVVTNLKTGESSPMRITDRGPFVEGRILDMTIASAKATGVYRAGLVQVRVDVYSTPKPIEVGGRWCVQIGAFHKEHDALKLQEQLEDRYPDANVLEFPGSDSYWVRIRPAGDNRAQAEEIAKRLRLKDADASAYLTRLD
jgi:rare lipoprotein A